nr:cutinase family protein [Corynebacterium lactis]
MKRIPPLAAGLSVAAVVTTMMPSVALAAPEVTVSKNNVAQSQTCPAVQMVLVNSGFDSTADSNTDSGFFSDVSAKVMDANGGKVDDPSAGFATASATSETNAPTSSRSSDSLWGSSTSTPSSSAAKDFGKDLWGSTESSTASSDPATANSGSATSSVTEEPSSGSGSSSVSSTSSSQAPEGSVASVANDPQKVGRIYINFDDRGGYIPGVNGEEKKEYSEAVGAAVGKVNDTLAEIHSACPDTRVMLMGYSEGAQVANVVAKQIGAGQSSFPADHVSGVALFSDPSRSESQPMVGNGAQAPAAAPGTSGENTSKLSDSLTPGKTNIAPDGAGVATLTDAAGGAGATGMTGGGGLSGAGLGGFGDLANRVISFCIEGDSTCAIPEGSPLRKIIASGAKSIDLNDPQKSLMAVADTLGPAVVLGGVESLADDLSFGPQGFQLARAENTDDTMVAKIASEADRPHDIGEMGQRLIQSGLKLGGMAMAAGITFAKDVITPTNLAQIAAAGAADPFAAIPVVATKLASAALNIVTPATATGVALRVFDEIKAAGLGDSQIAEVATQAATWKSMGSGAYKTTPVTADGRSATDLTADWARASVGDATGTSMPTISEAIAGAGQTASALTGLAGGTGGIPAFDPGAIGSALKLIGG